jgi:hypothetical protein
VFILLVFQDFRLFLLEFLEFILEVFLNFVFFGKIKEKRDLYIHGGTVFGLVFLFDEIEVDQRHKLILRQIRVLQEAVVYLFHLNAVFLFDFLIKRRAFDGIHVSSVVFFDNGAKGDFYRVLGPGTHIDQIVP